MDPCPIDVVLSQEHFILSQAKSTLWCDRRDGRLTAGTDLHRDSASDYRDLGQVWGVIGKLRFFTDGDWKLVVITQASRIGSLPQGGRVFCVERIGILPLTVQFDLSTEIVGFEACEVTDVSHSLGRPTSPTAARLMRGSVGAADKEKIKSKEVREREKMEKRLTEALLGMFNDSQSFYFSLDCALTLSFQWQMEHSKDIKDLPLWKQADERFFWNKWMINELLDDESNAELPLPSSSFLQTSHVLGPSIPYKKGSLVITFPLDLHRYTIDPMLAAPWILPVIQGYVEVRQIPVLLEDTPTILQPGWSKQYKEEREKIEQECMTEQKKQRSFSINAGEEVEMKEMACFKRDRLAIPLVKLIGPSSGYDYESDSDNYSDDEDASFSPMQFTNVMGKGFRDIKQAVFVGSPEKKVGEVVEEMGRAGMSSNADSLSVKSVGNKQLDAQSGCWCDDGDCEHCDVGNGGCHGRADGCHGGAGGCHDGAGGCESPSERCASNGLPRVPSPSSGKCVELIARTSEASGLTLEPPGRNLDCSEQTMESSEQPLPTQEQTRQISSGESDRRKNVSSQDLKSKFYAMFDEKDVCESEEEREGEGYGGGILGEQKSIFYMMKDQAKPDDTLVGLDGKEEGEEKGNEIDGKSLNSGHPPTKYYTSQDVPDLNGVVINLLDLENEDATVGVNRELLFSMEAMKTHGEASSEPTLEEFPLNLARESPIGNPFLGKQRSPSWVQHMHNGGEKEEKDSPPTFTLAIISRRSCKRAGTRYRRRGVDFEGHVANYVETELVLKCGSHVVSYVIVRGSVPLYWSQPGYKYRPLPVIENTVEETQKAFQKHFDKLFSLFKEIVVVNLVKQIGREKLVGDAFEQHVLLLNNPLLTYITFDFHQSYKANQVMSLQKLREGAAEFIRTFKFCWIDTGQSGAPLCKQEGVFRVNCMDCLDRTNVVESLFSREVLQIVLQKLGLLPFEEALGGSTLVSYQEMWANNGDIISKQYAGTAAMKGDITRYGERKISGMMKDGYNSAHRYYINIFRDSYRQVLIDLMQGVNPFEAFLSLPRSMQGMDELEDNCLTSSLHQIQPVTEDSWSLDKEEAVVEMVSQCQDELFPHNSSADLCSWMLMEPAGQSFVTDNKEDEPCLVIHSRKRETLSIAKFSVTAKRVVCFLQIEMSQIEKIIVGQFGVLLWNNKHLHMRIYYSLMEGTSCYFTFTTTNLVSIREERAILLSIAEFLASMQPSLVIQEQTINRKRSPPHQGIVDLVPSNRDSVHIKPSSHLEAVHMDSSRSHDSNTTTPSLDMEKADSPINKGSEVSVEDEVSLSVPSSPKIKCSLHRRKQSLSLDDITIEDTSKLLSPQRGPAIRICSPSRDKSNEVMSPLFKGIGSDESGSESELDLFDVLEEERQSQMPSNVKNSSDIPLLDVVNDLKESDDDEDESTGGGGEGWGGGKLSKLKGRLLMKVKSSKNSFMPRPRSHSPVLSSDITSSTYNTTPKKNILPLALSDSHKGDATVTSNSSYAGGSGADGAQCVGAVKQRFRVNSPSLWSKMIRRTSPSASPGSGEEVVVKLEEARKRSKSRLVFI